MMRGKRVVMILLATCAVSAVSPPQDATAALVTAKSLTWAGIEMSVPYSPGAHWSMADITVPSATCTSATTYGSAWLGWGGSSAKYSLPQLGFNFACRSGVARYSAWVEWYDPKVGNPQIPVAIGVKPGELVELQLSQSRTRTGVWTAHFKVFHSNGTSTTKGVLLGRVRGSNSPVGPTAECIVESPLLPGGAIAPLTKFSRIDVGYCEADGHYSGGANTPFKSITMVNRAGLTRAYTTLSPKPDEFSVSWMRY